MLMTPDKAAKRSDESFIIRTVDERDLDRILSANVQAVIYHPPTRPAWLVDLAAAVQSGAFQIPRIILPDVSRDEITSWLEANLPAETLAPAVRRALMEDVVALVDRLGRLGKVARFMLRIFTGAPTTDCGFHVDTVAPGAPAIGLLRVYNGAGTPYVEPGNVTSMREFYRYLSRRERLERERGSARRDGDRQTRESVEGEIMRLDRDLDFLKRPGETPVAPAGSIVALKHLDLSLHWSDHAKGLAWIHCSPMEGEPRLVVNITPAQVTSRFVRREASETAP
jgi:hypothetical protein